MHKLILCNCIEIIKVFSLSNGQTDRRLAAVRTYLPGVNFLCFDWLCWDCHEHQELYERNFQPFFAYSLYNSEFWWWL